LIILYWTSKAKDFSWSVIQEGMDLIQIFLSYCLKTPARQGLAGGENR